jgi:hypothetical protein
MIRTVRDDAAGEADDPEAFDRKVAEVYNAEAGMLHEKSDLLMVTGSAEIKRPAGMLRASLRPPRWWRHGVLREWAVRQDDATLSSVTPLGRTTDAKSVLSQIMLQLAVSVAWLDELDSR